MNVNSDFMELHVSVVDEKDRNVGGLTKENFKIKENGIPQPITIFKHEDIPVSLGLVIDNSRSMEPRKARLDAAALAFVRQSHPDDESFIVHFDFDARLDRDFTTQLSDLEETLAASKPFGQTAIYDAVMIALDHMQKARHQKKAMLLVTDGLDNASKTTFAQVLEAVKHSRVTIIVVGLLSASEGEKAEETLTKLAEASGGRAYFPDDVEQARVNDGTCGPRSANAVHDWIRPKRPRTRRNVAVRTRGNHPTPRFEGKAQCRLPAWLLSSERVIP